MEALISTAEAARRLGISIRTMQLLINDKEVKMRVAKRMKRKALLAWPDVEAFWAKKFPQEKS